MSEESKEPEEPLGPIERAALASLPRQRQPPADLEERVVRSLAARGYLRPEWRMRPALIRAAAALAAAALLFAGGVLTGRRETAPAAAAAGGRYILLLRADRTFKTPPGGHGALVEEYRSWARATRRAGAMEAGEELAGRGWLLAGAGQEIDLAAADTAAPPPPGAGARIGGYFVIHAANAAQALQIARSCPHLRHGGWIELRPIKPT